MLNLPSLRPSWRSALFVLCVAFLLRLPAFWTPIVDVDEAQFAGYADALLRGGLPYISSVDTKPLASYWFYEAAFALFGSNNMLAVHLLTALWVALTAFFCCRIAARLSSREAGPPTSPANGLARRAGFWAALLYAVFTTAYIPKFIGTSIAILMMLPLTMSIDAALAWERSQRMRWMWLAGLLWGAGCLFKYQAGINLVVMGAYLLVVRPLLVERSLRGARIKAFAAFVAGGAIVGGLFALYLIAIGAWNAFVFWSLAGSVAYVEKAATHTTFWKPLAIRGGSVVASGLLLWAAAAVRAGRHLRACVSAPAEAAPRREEALVVLWLLCSFIPVCIGGKFYGHYFLQLYPALAILGGLAVARFLARARAASAARSRCACALIAAGLLLPAIGFFAARLAASRIYAAIGEEDPERYRPIADYLKAHTVPSEAIFVWGFATPIYTYADRPAASRFLWTDWQTGRISGTPSAKDPAFDTTAFVTPGSWEMLFTDLTRTKPAYFVDTAPGNYHDYGKYPVAKYPDLLAYLRANYHPEATVGLAHLYHRNEAAR